MSKCAMAMARRYERKIHQLLHKNKMESRAAVDVGIMLEKGVDTAHCQHWAWIHHEARWAGTKFSRQAKSQLGILFGVECVSASPKSHLDKEVKSLFASFQVVETPLSRPITCWSSIWAAHPARIVCLLSSR
jgi:hypothetical protein